MFQYFSPKKFLKTSLFSTKIEYPFNILLTRVLTLYSLYLLIGMLHESCHLVWPEKVSLHNNDK